MLLKNDVMRAEKGHLILMRNCFFDESVCDEAFHRRRGVYLMEAL